MVELFTMQSHGLLTLRKKPFENIVGKGENAVTSIFSFFLNVFYSLQNIFKIFSHIYFVVC